MKDFVAPLGDPISREVALAVESVSGWQGVQRGLQMAQLILDSCPRVVVEIGVYAGRSLLPMALALKHNKAGLIYGIDPWSAAEVKRSQAPEEDWDPSQEHLEDVYRDLLTRITRERLPAVLLRSTSAQCARAFGVIDILHIDGGHGEGNALLDVESYVPLVCRGGYIWFDDSNWKSTRKALRRLEEMSSLENDQGTYRLYKRR